MDRLDDHESRWFALRTPNRHEKMAAKFLEREGVEYYLPLQTVKRKYQRKIVKRELCLLPCYIFARVVRADVSKIYRNPYANFLKIGATRLDVSQQDIDLMRYITGDAELEWQPYTSNDWQAGDLVELVGGSYTGLKGYFVEKKNKKQFVVTIESLSLAGSHPLVATVDSRYIIRPIKGNDD